MNCKTFQGTAVSCLGMGNMRLPTFAPEDPQKIRYEDAFPVIDAAYKSGITYFDTAYVYNNGDSEQCLGACMKKYPRESFQLATKFNLIANPDYEAVFEEQLERLQTDYIDFYLLHCILDDRAQKYIDSGAIEFFQKKKAEGKIRYFGFSSHASPETLEKFASLQQWDFAQIQLNYFDWAYRTARQEYEILHGKNIPIMVMEPVRGGRLSSLCPEAEALLKAARPDWSISSWAMRFVKSLPGIQVVLSGMNSLAQVADNTAVFSDDTEFTAEDEKTLFAACDLFRSYLEVPCTGCGYCVPKCPMQINIPEFMKLYNEYRVNREEKVKGLEKVSSVGTVQDCLSCGACRKQCPQGINIPQILKELRENT